MLQFQPNRGGLRHALLASLATAALAAAVPAQAAGERQIKLPAGPLETALTALATQTGDQLVYAPEIVAGRRGPALSGRYTADAALARLLAASNIVATRAGPKVIVLKTRRAAPTERPRAIPAAGATEAPPFADEPVRSGREAGPAAPEAPALPPTAVAEVRVTGTHIRGGSPAAPVIVLDRAALEATGHATVAAALQSLPQNFGGESTEATVAVRADRLATTPATARA